MTRIPLLGAVLAVTVALAGCAAASSGSGSGQTTAAPAPAASGATPFTFPCDSLVDGPTLAAFDTGMTAVSTLTVDGATSAGKIQGLGGTVCEWADPSGGTLIVAVAQLDAATLKSTEASVSAVAEPASVAEGSIPSYFTGHEVDAFTETGFWVSATSSLFTAAADANPIFDDVLQALPSGG